MHIRILSILLAFIAGPALAELSVMDRLADCLGPRAQAQALETWHNAPCQRTGDCSPIEWVATDENIEALCVFEAIGVCAIAAEPEPALCFGKVIAFMDSEIARIPPAFSEQRLDAITAQATGLQKSFIKRHIKELRVAPTVECPRPMPWPYDGSVGLDGCNFYKKTIRFTHLRMTERILIRRESHHD